MFFPKVKDQAVTFFRMKDDMLDEWDMYLELVYGWAWLDAAQYKQDMDARNVQRAAAGVELLKSILEIDKIAANTARAPVQAARWANVPN